MLTFDRYLFKKIILSTIVGVIFTSALAISTQVIKDLQEIFSFEADGGKVLILFLLNTFPYILTYMLPWAFLTSILLTIKSLSSNNEIVSIRMSGQSYLRVAMPIFILGALFSGLLYYTSGYITPDSRYRITKLINPDEAASGVIKPSPQLIQNSLGKEFKVFAGKINDNTIENLHIYEISPETERPSIYHHAEKAQLHFRDNGKITFSLSNAYIESPSGGGHPDIFLADSASSLNFPSRTRKPPTRAKYLTNNKIVAFLKKNADNKKLKEDRLDHFAELCSRISMSLACISYSILGLPMSLQRGRRQSNYTFLWGVLTVALFLGSLEGLMGVGDTYITRGVAIFLPNIIAIIIGAVMFRKVRFS